MAEIMLGKTAPFLETTRLVATNYHDTADFIKIPDTKTFCLANSKTKKRATKYILHDFLKEMDKETKLQITKMSYSRK